MLKQHLACYKRGQLAEKEAQREAAYQEDEESQDGDEGEEDEGQEVQLNQVFLVTYDCMLLVRSVIVLVSNEELLLVDFCRSHCKGVTSHIGIPGNPVVTQFFQIRIFQ